MDDFTDEQKIAAYATAECVEGDNLTYEASLARLQEVYRLGVATGKALVSTPLTPSITIWRFADAPQEYRDLSKFDGRDGWIMVVPNDLCLVQPFWLAEQNVHEFRYPDVYTDTKVAVGVYVFTKEFL